MPWRLRAWVQLKNEIDVADTGLEPVHLSVDPFGISAYLRCLGLATLIGCTAPLV